MMTLYGVVYQKKETMIRVIMGENLNAIFVKNMIIDTVSFPLLFLLISLLLYRFSNVYFKISFILLLFVMFLAVNTLLNATILCTHFKKDIAGGNSGRGLLTANYVLKVATTILAILILSSNVIIIRAGYNLYQQKGFFERHKDYCYYQLNYKLDNHIGKTDEDDLSMNQEFYQRFQERSRQYVDLTENFDSSYPVLLNNRASMKDIKSNAPSIAAAVKKVTKKKVYLFLPSNLSASSKEHKVALAIGDAFFSEARYGDIETITYEKGISLVGIHCQDDYQMKYYKNPIILYNNTIFQTNKWKAGYDSYYAYDTMYDIPSNDWKAFVREFQLENQLFKKLNVLDVYKHSWSLVSRNMKLILLLSAFLIFLEMTLIIYMIRLHYQFNAIELALKKIHGYSLFNRNKPILTVTIISSFAGILTAFVFSSVLGMPGGYPLVVTGLLLLTLELSYILIKASAIEKTAVVPILKGEKL